MWKPHNPEIEIGVDPCQHALYRDHDPACLYQAVRWPRAFGRSRHGEFPVVVAREHFRALGYTVWAAEPELPDGDGFILAAYPGKRRRRHPAYTRMEQILGTEVVRELNGIADVEKRRLTGNAGGGDPDLFVFSGSDRFFVEVRWRDQITEKQCVTFPLIERFCNVEIKMGRLCERDIS